MHGASVQQQYCFIRSLHSLAGFCKKHEQLCRDPAAFSPYYVNAGSALGLQGVQICDSQDMFNVYNQLWQQWLHSRVVTNEYDMRQSTSFRNVSRYQHWHRVSLRRQHALWSSWLWAILTESRFRRIDSSSDAAILASRARCHCHDVCTWASTNWVPKGRFRVLVLGPFSGPSFNYK